jgi:hypothetical protein
MRRFRGACVSWYVRRPNQRSRREWHAATVLVALFMATLATPWLLAYGCAPASPSAADDHGAHLAIASSDVTYACADGAHVLRSERHVPALPEFVASGDAPMLAFERARTPYPTPQLPRVSSHDPPPEHPPALLSR